jgi:adenylate cyclase class IV
MDKAAYFHSLHVSGWDSYFTLGSDFMRYRQSPDKPELTMKRKTKDSNNWERVEVDVELGTGHDPDSVYKFCDMAGFKLDFKIYKSCFIYWVGDVNYVYYIVYDENMKELDRFIEVEVTKGSNLSKAKAVKKLKEAEDRLHYLDIMSKNRLKKSIFELYSNRGLK